ncbi:MAG: LysR family transcriptional regulator [Proteobacteria bacterium]|nr:LysR family transcriptional regulator [Pseudomonadota bacterium]
MDRLEGISAFVAVARNGGFSAAARASGIPLATVSRRVGDLERELGVRLLHRTTRHVGLTDAGREYLETCARLLDDLREAEEAIAGAQRAPKGELSVTAPIAFGRLHLQPIAVEFLKAYPEIRLRLLLVDRVVNLVEEQVDAAVRISPLADSTLVARPVGHIRMVVCASPTYLAAHGAPRHPSELATHDCIAWSALGAGGDWYFREEGEDRAHRVRARLATTIAESATAAAEASLGLVQVTSYQAEAALLAGALRPVLRAFECEPTPVSLVHASNRLVPLRLRAFLDFVAPRLTERLKRVQASLEDAG